MTNVYSRTASDLAAIQNGFCELFRNDSPDDLTESLSEWVRTQPGFPTPADIRPLVDERAARRAANAGLKALPSFAVLTDMTELGRPEYEKEGLNHNQRAASECAEHGKCALWRTRNGGEIYWGPWKYPASKDGKKFDFKLDKIECPKCAARRCGFKTI